MSTYIISLYGCDDTTSFEMNLGDREAELLMRVSELSKQTSTYGCMPTLGIEELKYKATGEIQS